ncbi:unnamed protein product [Calypogeia fissa]
MEVETANQIVPQKPIEETVCAMGKAFLEASSSRNMEAQTFVNKLPQPALKDALLKASLPHDGPVVVVDLGRSSGPTAIDNVALIIDQLRLQLQPKDHVEFQAYFNDLPSNDFNHLFQLLTNDGRARTFFAAGAPGSFYDRLFAESSVHVFHSSCCLHWLSTIPNVVLHNVNTPGCNEGNVWTIHSSSAMAKAYQQQAALDLKMFLNARAAELISGGLLFVTLPGRSSSEPNESWDEFSFDFSEVWSALVAEGSITEEQLDTFNLPCYMRSIEDIKEALASCSSLFDVLTAKVHTFDGTTPHSFVDDSEHTLSELEVLSRKTVLVYKAVINAFVEAHVGKETAELMWLRYLELIEKKMKLGKLVAPLCIVALIRK